MRCGVQRHKKTGEALMSDDGSTPLPLTSHTLAPVPVAIGGKGLPDSVVFRDDLPDAGLANITGALVALDSPSFNSSKSLKRKRTRQI